MKSNEARRRLLGAGSAAGALALLEAATARLAVAREGAATEMPVIFIGHGSPMNALRDNDFTRTLAKLGRSLPRPTAVLAVSAHWLTPGSTLVGAQTRPKTIHDFGGFPRPLQEMQYPAPGAPEVAGLAAKAVEVAQVGVTEDWGLDHGTWTVLRHIYPHADVPVLQLSIDYAKPAAHHYEIGRQLRALRSKGVLIMGSGNVVHNLGETDRDAPDGAPSRAWARDFDLGVKTALDARNDFALVSYARLGPAARMAVPTPDHYYPMLYALGAADRKEAARTVFEGFQSGTLSMRCFQFG